MGKNNPILLPKNDYFTKLVIIAAHKRLIHAGAAQTLAETRKSYWIRKIIRQCLICIHWEGGPFKTLDFAVLPNFIVDNSCRKPFEIIGIDYLGPIMVKENSDMKKIGFACSHACTLEPYIL